MKFMSSEKIRERTIAGTFVWAVLLISLTSNGFRVFAHGGEDHGDEKPKVETSGQGMVLRTARLGDFEVVLKHPVTEPDVALTGRLFISKFSTNEPADVTDLVVEIESAAGAVTNGRIEKMDAPGTYALTLPPLPEGSYTIRVTASPGGSTHTVTFSGVDIAHAETATASSGVSWLQAAFMGLLFLIALALFGGLVYLAVVAVRTRPLREETASA